MSSGSLISSLSIRPLQPRPAGQRVGPIPARRPLSVRRSPPRPTTNKWSPPRPGRWSLRPALAPGSGRAGLSVSVSKRSGRSIWPLVAWRMEAHDLQSVGTQHDCSGGPTVAEVREEKIRCRCGRISGSVVKHGKPTLVELVLLIRVSVVGGPCVRGDSIRSP
jgi:hypothetical protein